MEFRKRWGMPEVRHLGKSWPVRLMVSGEKTYHGGDPGVPSDQGGGWCHRLGRGRVKLNCSGNRLWIFCGFDVQAPPTQACPVWFWEGGDIGRVTSLRAGFQSTIQPGVLCWRQDRPLDMSS